MEKKAEKTQQTYWRLFLRLVSESKSPGDIFSLARQTKSRNTWFTRRAAVLYACSNRNEMPENVAEACRGLSQSFFDEAQKLFKEAPPIEDREERKSKRKDMKGLPVDWREVLWKDVSLEKYRIQYTVAALTGCQPADLEKGVAVRISDDGKNITFEIKGSRITEAAGQPTRSIGFEINNENCFMEALLKEYSTLRRGHGDDFALTVTIDSAKNFSAAINRASKRLAMGGEKGLTAYNLRHAFSSDMKAAKLSSEQIAKLLGHSTEKSQSRLGQSRMSKGKRIVPITIESAREIKKAVPVEKRVK